MDPFELPEDLSALEPDELSSLHEAALAEFDDLNSQTPRTPDTVARMRELRDGLNSLRGEMNARQAAEDEAEALASEVHASDDEDQDEPNGEEEETEEEATAMATDPAPADETEPAPTAAATASTDPAPSTTAEATPAAAPESEAVPVAASATPARPSAADLVAQGNGDTPVEATLEPAVTRTPATIVAAANLPGHDTGETLDMDGVVRAFQDRIRGFPKGRSGGYVRAGIARIVKPFADDQKVPEGQDATAYLDRAVDETALPGGSLVAAGGWCAPSETIYDLCSIETTDGLLSLPSVGVSRGGIRHTLGPDFRAIYDSTGFTFTETDDIAGDYDGAGGDKPCAVVPCPDFTEDRLDVAGLCITSGILQETAYPELLRRFTEGALIGHAHRLNDLKISAIVAGSTAVSPTAFANAGPTMNLLSSIELVGTDMRYRNRMANNASLEVVLPFWARGVVRADLSNRLGVDMLQVTDAMISAWFATRNANVQYVYDWQDDLADGASGFGFVNPITTWPTTLDFLIYPAGTWVAGEEDIITLDAIYDSVNLPKNNFTALFTEEGWMVMQRCHDSRVVTVDLSTGMGDANAGTAAA